MTTTDGYIVTMNLLWNVENANGSSTAGCYVKFGDVTLFWCGQDRNLKITIGSTETALISGGNSNLRGTDFNVEISINKTTKDVNYSISNSSYNSGTAITGSGTSATGDVSNVIFGWWRGGQRNASSQIVKSLVITEAPLMVATPTFTIGSYNYEQGGYAVTPSCATVGATLTYTIDGGAATACTSGTPFYAKNGKLNITASKAGWSSSSLATDDQWTLNVAPSSSSPETLIPFQKSNDNGDKNIEHVYKSVTIAGGGSSAIAGIVSGDANALKLRTNQNSNTVTLNVNSGYVVTRVSIEAKSNNKGTGATIGLTSTTVDGGSNIMAGTTTFPISTADAVTYDTNGTAINAKNNIVFTFDNSAIDGTDGKKNYQIQATIKVWYKTPVEIAIEDCKSHETSSAFATYIEGLFDAGSLNTADDVYAAHTAWQIAQADAASSNDITKVIFDAAVSDFSRWNNARSNQNEQYTGAPDNKYFDGWDSQPSDGKQKIYGLPAGTYTIKVATRASATLTDVSKYKVWVYGGSADVSVLGNHIGNTGGVLGNGWNWTILSFTLSAKADVEIGFYTRPGGGSGLWAGCDDWHLYKGTLSASATVGANGYTTFASPYPLDLTDANRPEGLKAYKATLTGSTLSFTKLNQTVPAGTGLLLLGETKGSSYDIPVASSVDEITTAFTGVTTATALHSVADNTYYFVMKKAATAEDALAFAPLSTSDVTIPAGKAYITVPNSAFTGGARALDISFDDEETTGISDATRLNDNEKMINDNFYDLSGRKVAQPTKGLYIVNGKKVVIK